MKNNDFEDVVYGRVSVKNFDESVKIPREQILEILDKAVLAPSSVNMQPWRFVVVDSKEGKEKLRPLVKFNARQNDTSAAMIVIFGDLKCYEKAEEIFARSVKKGYMSEEFKKEKLAQFLPYFQNAPYQKMHDNSVMNCSLVAMQLMLVARTYGYDTNAIGGFEYDKITGVLGLDESRYEPVMIVAIGKADYEVHGSVRLKADELTTFM
ncbi:MAG: nitroreductase family protein [Campylobacteraceae bacterium]|nr:nitroreductase family protein [Campylobacteraceae bacterium]